MKHKYLRGLAVILGIASIVVIGASLYFSNQRQQVAATKSQHDYQAMLDCKVLGDKYVSYTNGQQLSYAIDYQVHYNPDTSMCLLYDQENQSLVPSTAKPQMLWQVINLYTNESLASYITLGGKPALPGYDYSYARFLEQKQEYGFPQ